MTKSLFNSNIADHLLNNLDEFKMIVAKSKHDALLPIRVLRGDKQQYLEMFIAVTVK